MPLWVWTHQHLMRGNVQGLCTQMVACPARTPRHWVKSRCPSLPRDHKQRTCTMWRDCTHGSSMHACHGHAHAPPRRHFVDYVMPFFGAQLDLQHQTPQHKKSCSHAQHTSRCLQEVRCCFEGLVCDNGSLTQEAAHFSGSSWLYQEGM